MAIKDILTVGSDGQATAGGAGLNEQPVKNYLKTYANSDVTPVVAGTAITATGNLVSLTSAHVSNLSTTLTSVASTTLRGANNYLTSMADTSTTGAAFYQLPAFTLDGTDIGKPVSISFDVNGVTADGNWDVVIARYNSAGVYGSLISVAGNASGSTPPSAKLPTGTTTFNGFFVPDSTTATDLYAIRLRHRVSNAAIRIDTLFIGPQPIRVGAAITNDISWTPSFNNFSTAYATQKGTWRQVGNRMQANVDIVLGAVSAIGGIYTVTIPGGYSIDGTILPTNDEHGVGSIYIWDASASYAMTYGSVHVDTATTLKFKMHGQTSFNSATAPITLAVGDFVGIIFDVPISTWSSNVTMADRAVEEYAFNTSGITSAGASDTTAFGYGIGGAAIGSIASTTTTGFSATTMRCRFTTPIQPTDRIIVEFDGGSGGLRWVSSNDCLNPYMGQLTALYGAGVGIVNATDVDVSFGNGGRWPSNASYGGSGQAWSGISSWRWRVRKVSSGAQVGYPISSANIVGRTDGNAPAAGMVGETVFARSGTASIAVGSGTRGVGTLSIPSAGRWKIHAYLFAPWSGAAGNSSLILSTVGPTSTSFPEHGNTIGGYSDVPMVTTEGNTRQGIASEVIAAFTGPATIYLNAFTSNSVSATATFVLQATRVV